MQVKIGTIIYDARKEPIMLILSEQDKCNIANMAPFLLKYCAFPEGMSEEQVREFMETSLPEEES